MTEEVKKAEVKPAVTPKVTVKPVAKPVAKPAPKVVMGDKTDVEKFVDVATTIGAGKDVAREVKVERKAEEPKLSASVRAEQAAGRAALERNVKR